VIERQAYGWSFQPKDDQFETYGRVWYQRLADLLYRMPGPPLCSFLVPPQPAMCSGWREFLEQRLPNLHRDTLLKQAQEQQLVEEMLVEHGVL